MLIDIGIPVYGHSHCNLAVPGKRASEMFPE